MEYRRFGSSVAVRLSVGEDISKSLLSLAEKENIRLGSVSGIGATDDFTIGVFNLETRAYDRFRFTGNHEITSLSGNFTTMDQKPYLHLHITCAGADGKLVGGHLLASRISLTAEIWIQVVPGEAERKRDEELGINLISFA